MHQHIGHVMTLANSIIGVSVLAMPYCFKQCGIVLSILMLFASSVISRLACHFLLKSAIMARRKTFEFLAFHTFGPLGKLITEIGLIGFLLGTCIAFFVVMGDLGPEIISEMTGTRVTSTLRTSILMALALFCVLPLGLLRNVDSLNGVSKATIGFYCCLVLKIVIESLPRFFSENWFARVEMWRPAGILQCLPIFSMALFCQTQLFEIYQAVPNASLENMNDIIRVAVNICTVVYVFVGFFGYIAFFQQPFTGNILMSFRPSIMTDVMKIGFVLSVAFSFPLVIFPCRASLYSLLYKNSYQIHEGSSNNYIPEGKFKTITFIIVFISLVTGVLIPNIELVLGLVGSTIGVMICVLFPVACFISMSPKNTNERILAQMMLFIGVVVMVLGTYANLYEMEKINYTTEKQQPLKPLMVEKNEKVVFSVPATTNKPIVKLSEKKTNVEEILSPPKQDTVKEARHEPPQPVEPAQPPEPKKEIRHEPPQPVEPVENTNVVKKVPKIDEVKKTEELKKNQQKPPIEEKTADNKPTFNSAINIDDKLKEKKEQAEKINNLAESSTDVVDIKQKPSPVPAVVKDEVDIEAIKKEETELKEQEKEKLKDVVKNQDLIDTLQKQNQVQEELVKQQKELIEVIKQQQQALEIEKQNKEMEKLRAVQHIEKIAKQAIESLSIKNVDDKGKPANKNEVDKDIVANPAPLSYQLGLNQNRKKNDVDTDDKTVKFIKSDFKKLIPIPIALNDNFSTIYRKRESENKSLVEIVRGDVKKKAVVLDEPSIKTPQKILKEAEIKTEKPTVTENNVVRQLPLVTRTDDKNKPQSIGRDILYHKDTARKKREIMENADECDKNNRMLTGNEIALSDLNLVSIGLKVDNLQRDFKRRK